MKIEVVLALPGDPETVTGGYVYDRRIAAELPGQGVAASILRLPDDFPLPAHESVDLAFARLAAVPRGTLMMIDGLALAVLPPDRLAALGRPIVGLVHHPLALETGLSADVAARLAASERAALAVTAAVIVTSPATAATLKQDFGVAAERVTVALPGTDRLPQARGGAVDGGPPAILAVGSIIPRKGHDVLVAALDRLRDRPWRLTIVGGQDRDPACTAQLKATIAGRGLADRVALVDAVDRARLAELYAAADVFALLSAYEGYGMAFAEALAAGLPIVACDGGAIADTVPPQAGFLVPPGDAAAAAAALARLLDDPELRRAKAAGARAAGLALPGWDATAATIAGVLRRVAAADAVARAAGESAVTSARRRPPGR